jgi:trk system potassium uptake protein TrkH
MLLIIAGGMGFTVLIDSLRLFSRQGHKASLSTWRRLSLNSKLAISVTLLLLVAGTAFFALFEWNNPATLKGKSALVKWLLAAFQSVTLRTAGFNSIDQAGMTDISKALSCVLMLIGGSPAGTAGGIKTVTLAVIAASVASALKGRDTIEAYGRNLPLDLLQKALTVVGVMLSLVTISTIILHFTELRDGASLPFIDILYEVCSAAGTVGVTAGLTASATNAGKIVLMLCMFMGRLGPVTVVMALNMRLQTRYGGRKFIDERVIIG